ncbi:sensor histidine kinase [Bacillus pseudomycoides]|uniref:sensor histidine kinase n=1 Tax=Bacillus pseudomycoides TaxID=64104 RepID=UPI002FFECE14
MNKMMYIKNSTLKIVYFFSMFLVINFVLLSSKPIQATFDDIVYMDFLIIIISLFFMVIDYRRWKDSYQGMSEAECKGKDIDSSIPETNNYFEIQLIKDILKLKNAEMEDKVEEVRVLLDEVNDYIIKWIHEIKIPIAVCELIADKMEEIDVSEELRLEIDRIKFLINQVLYTSRASSFSEDLHISEINMGRVVKDVIKRNVSFFMAKNIDVKLENINFHVMTDEKWLAYMVDQIINNACKYVSKGGKVNIYAEEDERMVRLHIRDNGVGIKEKDIKRIFDKGFTGENGRGVAKSTGMGLYLSKKMAHKLSHDLFVESKEGIGTEFTICFYKLSDYFNIT